MFAFNVQPAKAQSGTIYINPNGSISSPVPANITNSGNVTYTFTGNNYLPIVVDRSNIVIDGNGCVLQGNSPKPGSEENGRGIDLSFSDNVTVKNVQIENFFDGIYLCHSSNETISGNNITANTWEGISLQDSSNNTISGNVITNNTSDGIGLWYFSDYTNTICGNSIENNTDGIIDQSSNIIISDNKIAYNQIGLCLNDSLNNTIIGNTATANGYGISLQYSSNNNVFHNNFVGNVVQVSVDSWSVGNIWDKGYPSAGNYWSNYNGTDLYSGQYQNVTGSDGIGDTPYKINANNTDRYPLMGPFHTFSVGTWDGVAYSVDIVSNSSISDLSFNATARTLSFNVTGPSGTVGFCRIAIPKKLMWCNTNDQWKVTVNGTLISERTITTDANYTYIYFTYHCSTETVQITSTNEQRESLSPWLVLGLVILGVGGVALLVYLVRTRKTRKTTEKEKERALNARVPC
jgi:parallel beta-helix repeat protein